MEQVLVICILRHFHPLIVLSWQPHHCGCQRRKEDVLGQASPTVIRGVVRCAMVALLRSWPVGMVPIRFNCALAAQEARQFVSVPGHYWRPPPYIFTVLFRQHELVQVTNHIMPDTSTTYHHISQQIMATVFQCTVLSVEYGQKRFRLLSMNR